MRVYYLSSILNWSKLTYFWGVDTATVKDCDNDFALQITTKLLISPRKNIYDNTGTKCCTKYFSTMKMTKDEKFFFLTNLLTIIIQLVICITFQHFSVFIQWAPSHMNNDLKINSDQHLVFCRYQKPRMQNWLCWLLKWFTSVFTR